MRIVVLAMTLAIVLFAAACTTGRTDVTREQDLQTVQPPGPDRGLRDVSKAIRYKDGIAYVLDETAMQMVCGALSEAEWADVLGSPVSRTVYGGNDPSCVVDTGTYKVTLRRTGGALDSTAGERIDSRDAEIHPTGRASVMMVAVDAMDKQANPILTTLVSAETDKDRPSDISDRIRRLFTMVLPRLAPTGKPAAPFTEPGLDKLIYTATEPVAGVPVYDLPRQVQSQMLCTAVIQATGVTPKPRDISVLSMGMCIVYEPGITVVLTTRGSAIPDPAPDRVGGRAAQVLPNGDVLVNVLKTEKTRGTDGDLTLQFKPTGKQIDLRPVAEKVVTRLLP